MAVLDQSEFSKEAQHIIKNNTEDDQAAKAQKIRKEGLVWAPPFGTSPCKTCIRAKAKNSQAKNIARNMQNLVRDLLREEHHRKKNKGKAKPDRSILPKRGVEIELLRTIIKIPRKKKTNNRKKGKKSGVTHLRAPLMVKIWQPRSEVAITI